jgi:hypothetical protein
MVNTMIKNLVVSISIPIFLSHFLFASKP